MHQQNRGRLPGAEIEHPQVLAAGIDVAREEGAVFSCFLKGRLRRNKSGPPILPKMLRPQCIT